ncbi:hypothetical protein SAMN04487760_10991 [Lachnospiraceae bacterium G41]|nr:hypothetical protein SAMN04487760_10991 [Lachnospiraceae bacterium G41]
MDNKEIFNRIFPTACRYMRVNPLLVDEEFNLKSFKVFETLMENVRFKGQHEYISVEDLMNVDKELTGKSEDLSFYLEGCTEAVVFATTLGVNVDAYSKKLQSRDMSLAVIYDSLASALLEFYTDEYENGLSLGAHTFRFAPGYGDIPIELNYIIIDALSISKKIGIYKSSNNMMLPQKSMITFCGLGKEVAPTCAHCIRLNNCSLRKEGFRCYNS